MINSFTLFTDNYLGNITQVAHDISDQVLLLYENEVIFLLVSDNLIPSGLVSATISLTLNFDSSITLGINDSKNLYYNHLT